MVWPKCQHVELRYPTVCIREKCNLLDILLCVLCFRTLLASCWQRFESQNRRGTKCFRQRLTVNLVLIECLRVFRVRKWVIPVARTVSKCLDSESYLCARDVQKNYWSPFLLMAMSGSWWHSGIKPDSHKLILGISWTHLTSY